MRSMKQLRTVFVDGNGIIAKKSSKELVSLLQQDVNIVLRLHSDPDVIYAMPTYYDGTENVMWFQYNSATNNLQQIVGVDSSGELVYYTGE